MRNVFQFIRSVSGAALITILMMQNGTAQNAEIVYFGDPMCSWCYGISEELAKLKEAYADKAGFRVVVGGLRPNETEPMDEQLKDFLAKHWKEVNGRSGRPFAFDIMERDDFVYNTEPACRAVVTARHLKPEVEFQFFKDVQYAFYAKNEDTNEVDTYLDIAEKHGIDREEYKAYFESDDAKKATQGDFVTSAEMGVRGFPTIVLRLGDKWYLVTNGYTTFEAMDTALKTVIN